MRRLLISGMLLAFSAQMQLNAHCQMPCGIYHDDMVFDQIDQYVETMVKGISVLTEGKFDTVSDRNRFVRWVMEKDTASDEATSLITKFFLQQKIKPGEDDTTKRVLSAHKLLFLIVQIKQSADLNILNEFYEEWEKFKLMFHIEGYECKMEQIKLKKIQEKKKVMEANPAAKGATAAPSPAAHSHDHGDDHDHDHDHGDAGHTH